MRSEPSRDHRVESETILSYSTAIGVRRYAFADLKELLAKASPLRSGDELANLAAGSAQERMAARLCLAALPLQAFLNEALIPYEEDEVTRLIIDTHDATACAQIAHLTKLVEHSPWQELRRYTPARIALGRVGNALPTEEVLRFGVAHAQARDAVHQPFEPERVALVLQQLGLQSVRVRSAAPDRWTYLRRPDLGRRLHPESRAVLRDQRAEPTPDFVLVIADGLSSTAVHAHAPALLAALLPQLAGETWVLAPVVIAKEGRVASATKSLSCSVRSWSSCSLCERPGLSAPDSLGVYLTFGPGVGRMDSERNCISNVRPQGLAYADAARKLHFLLRESRRLRLTGLGLKDDNDVPSLSADRVGTMSQARE